MTANRRPRRIAIIDDVDLFARGPDDELLHVHHGFDHGRSGSTEGRDLAGDPILISGTDGQRHIFARGRGGLLLHWKLDHFGKGDRPVQPPLADRVRPGGGGAAGRRHRALRPRRERRIDPLAGAGHRGSRPGRIARRVRRRHPGRRPPDGQDDHGRRGPRRRRRSELARGERTGHLAPHRQPRSDRRAGGDQLVQKPSRRPDARHRRRHALSDPHGFRRDQWPAADGGCGIRSAGPERRADPDQGDLVRARLQPARGSRVADLCDGHGVPEGAGLRPGHERAARPMALGRRGLRTC